MKKFYAVIGNPPYQEDVEGNGRANPIYPDFMDASYSVGEKVELITPARFLFNAGQTPKSWNKKMLEDKHLTVLEYVANGAEVFPNTDIKGGVAITYRDEKRTNKAIGVFVAHDELNSIMSKVSTQQESSISDIVTGAVPYRFTDLVRKEHPECVDEIGESFDLRTNILDKLNGKLFFSEAQPGEECIAIFGLVNRKRNCLWIKRYYISVPNNFSGYKVLVPKASGSGTYGEKLAELFVAASSVGHTQSFVSIGNLKTEDEANALSSYLKTKFTRSLLGILKVTQDITSRVWELVPLQDFTSASDIDWSQPVADIDRQLYKKYGLSKDEITFIESHVKEMK